MISTHCHLGLLEEPHVFTLLRGINQQRVPMVYTVRKNANFVYLNGGMRGEEVWERAPSFMPQYKQAQEAKKTQELETGRTRKREWMINRNLGDICKGVLGTLNTLDVFLLKERFDSLKSLCVSWEIGMKGTQDYLLDVGDLGREALRNLRDNFLNQSLVLHRFARLHDTIERNKVR